MLPTNVERVSVGLAMQIGVKFNHRELARRAGFHVGNNHAHTCQKFLLQHIRRHGAREHAEPDVGANFLGKRDQKFVQRGGYTHRVIVENDGVGNLMCIPFARYDYFGSVFSHAL